jgi:rfaE bifunctional protein nucleotidyltransferase chain/domain
MRGSGSDYPSRSRLGNRFLQTPESLVAVVERLRREGKTIVTTNGCFDLLHMGHLHILSEAKAQGDILIVGLNSDRSAGLLKGPTRPIVPEEERAEILLSLEWVDYVALFHERDCIEFVKRVRPDVHVNDASYGEDCIESEAVRERGGRLHLVSKLPVSSTTDLIGKIQDLTPSRSEKSDSD